jgi:hypothetical protein
MSEFVPVWMFPATLLYLGATLLASLVTVGWALSITGDKPAPSLSDFADTFRDPVLVAVSVLCGVTLAGIAAGVHPPAEVAAVASALLMGSKLQLHMIKTAVVYHSTPRGETA